MITVLKLIVGEKVWRNWNLRLPAIPFNEQRYFTTEEMVQVVNAARGRSGASRKLIGDKSQMIWEHYKSSKVAAKGNAA